MASPYGVAIGHDKDFPDIVDIVPQPRNGEVLEDRSYLLSGLFNQRPRCVFHWNVLLNATMYQLILTQFGIITALWCDVTIFTRSKRFVYNRYNGRAIQPEFIEDVSRANFFIRDLSIYVHSLVLLED